MKIIKYLLTIIAIGLANANKECKSNPSNNCITFTIGSGTGCAWMCSYCQSQLGTTNYYFIDNVCTYQSGIGCAGNPIAGNSYTCCSN